MRAELLPHLARQLCQDSGLTEAEYAILVVLSESRSHRIRARDLCRELGWERSRLSHQIARMERRGTVGRATCESDARGFDVVLTARGLAAIRDAAPQHVAAVRHCFADVLSARQMDALIGIADAITRHLASEHPDPS